MPVTHQTTPITTPIFEGCDGDVLAVENLHFHYPDGHVALQGVSLKLCEGDKVALVGPNGAGKSTLMLHLNGILAGEGEMSIAGLRIEPDNLPVIRAMVGLVFQSPDDQLFSPTVFEDVAFGPLNMGLPEDERFEDTDAEKTAILSPVEDLGIPSVSEAFSNWKQAGGLSREPFEYDVENTRWWAEFRPIWLENRTVWLGISLPEEELFQRIGVPRHVVPAAILIIGLIALIGSVFVVRRHAGQLQALTLEHERLSRDAVQQTQITDETAGEVLTLIEKGESEKLEFKSTARWNLRAGKAGKEIELAWLKGVVGFLNTDGGVLLIGVDDAGEVTGIGADNFESEDRCLRHIDNLINQHIGAEYLQFIRYGLVDIRGEKVVMIRCAPSNDPAFLKNNKEEDFYVRTGPASRKLSPSQILKYLEARHKG